MINKQKYVLGFMFSPEEDRVLLIKKNRPDFQEGKFNGLGGKMEEIDENNSFRTMIREFEEECGIRHENWDKFCELSGDTWTIDIFRATGNIDKVENKTDEEVFIVKIDELLNYDCLSNICWLIPMALNKKHLYIIEEL